MHVHASDKRMTEAHSAKFFVRADGSSVIKKRGDLTEREAGIIMRFIKENYLDMYKDVEEFWRWGFLQGIRKTLKFQNKGIAPPVDAIPFPYLYSLSFIAEN